MRPMSARPRKAFSYVRLSTDLQLRGSGLQRQLEASKAYADANGLVLQEDDQLRDIGISAYKGANIAEGSALGQFLAAMRDGRIEPGSVLIIESLDRLSRGRLMVGAGTGDDPQRFVAGGVPVHDGGQRLDEFIEVVRSIWSGRVEPFAGRHYTVPAVDVVRPGRQGGPPILIGTRSGSGYRRAARLGNGLLHPGGTAEEVRTAVAGVLEQREREGRRDGFELWTHVPAPASRSEWRETLDAYGATGVGGLIVAHDPRLLDLLRNPDIEDDRSDLALAQG